MKLHDFLYWNIQSVPVGMWLDRKYCEHVNNLISWRSVSQDSYA